jgi:KaiC/GvpD/RAD55 family RecA-like ATPase
MEEQLDLTRLGQEKLFLILLSAERFRQNNIRVIETLIGKGYRVVVITTNQPSAILKKHYAAEGIDMGKVTFIDAITKYAIGRIPEGETGTKFVNSPSNLTDLGIAITEVLNSVSGERSCLLFDLISTMLIYLPSIHISKFIHFVTSKLRLLDVPGIFLAVEKGIDPLLLTQLTTYVDDVIDMDRTPGSSAQDGKPSGT